jgi:anti-sigma regulatory factor (Ser/Thr protein kinase)
MVTLIDDQSTFRVAVADEAPTSEGTEVEFEDLEEAADLDDEPAPPGVGLAVISGLVDDVSVESGRDGGVIVRMTWPISA